MFKSAPIKHLSWTLYGVTTGMIVGAFTTSYQPLMLAATIIFILLILGSSINQYPTKYFKPLS